MPVFGSAAYLEVVTHRGAEPCHGRLTAYEADRVIERGLRLDCHFEPQLTGVIVMTRPGPGITVDLRPVHPPALTETQARDLELLADGGKLRVARGKITVVAGLCGIPASFAARLLDRGWLSVLTLEDGAPVSVSVAGRVALALHRHKARSSQPRGWYYPADYPHLPQAASDRHGGRAYDGSSWAICSCRWSHPCDRRPAAARAAKQHRIEMVTAAIRSLPSPTATP